VERLDFHGSLSIGNTALYALDDEKARAILIPSTIRFEVITCPLIQIFKINARR
jgi:hypothetical protein